MIYNEEEIMKEHWRETIQDYDVPQTIILAKHLGVDLDDAQSEIDSEDYLVLTDEEADEAVREAIEESLWAFTPSFLSAHTGVDEEVFKILQDKCEDSNDAIMSMIKDFDAFVEDAVCSDGRGHFLAGYDHEEHYCDWQRAERKGTKYETVTTEYYIYRRN